MKDIFTLIDRTDMAGAARGKWKSSWLALVSVAIYRSGSLTRCL